VIYIAENQCGKFTRQVFNVDSVGGKCMPEDCNGASAPPTNRHELITHLDAAVRLTEAEDGTAGFLLRLILNILRTPTLPNYVRPRS
jgi:hypothetical protein